jgi:hypothetical protein
MVPSMEPKRCVVRSPPRARPAEWTEWSSWTWAHPNEKQAFLLVRRFALSHQFTDGADAGIGGIKLGIFELPHRALGELHVGPPLSRRRRCDR